jgi:tRNA/rRNA methyltransferase
MTLTALTNCRIVLVRPAIAGNVGAAARVMRNFGLNDLRLVGPHADARSEQARKFSTHGEGILNAARSHADLGAAVAECTLVVATSARHGGRFRQQTVVSPRELMPRLALAAAQAPVALVFGPEQTGLTNAEVSRCHYLLTIPAAESYPALNLAQAVAICAYEFFLAASPAPEPTPKQVAEFGHQDRMFEKLRTALTDLHFLYGEKADSLMHALRHLIGRAQPSPMEVDVLLGLARQIEWRLKHLQAPQAAAIDEKATR